MTRPGSRTIHAGSSDCAPDPCTRRCRGPSEGMSSGTSISQIFPFTLRVFMISYLAAFAAFSKLIELIGSAGECLAEQVEQVRIDFALEALCELGRKEHDDLERPMIQAHALNKPGCVSREDCCAAHIPAERFAFPLEVGLRTIDRLIGEGQRIVHATCRCGEKGPNRLDTDEWPIHH